MENWKEKLEPMEKEEKVIIDDEEGGALRIGVFQSFTEDGRIRYKDENGTTTDNVIYFSKFDKVLWEEFQAQYQKCLEKYDEILDYEKELDNINLRKANKGVKIILWDEDSPYDISTGVIEEIFKYEEFEDISYKDDVSGEILDRSSYGVYKYSKDKWENYQKQKQELDDMVKILKETKEKFKAIYTPAEDENKYDMLYNWR